MVTVTYSNDDYALTLLPNLTAKELDEKYGKGFKIMEALGFVPGQSLGLGGLATPVSFGDMLQYHSHGIGFGSTDTAELTRRVSSARIDPPRCTSCNQHRWPAYRTRSSGNWTCIKCADIAGPKCSKCHIITWDGYNIPSKGFAETLGESGSALHVGNHRQNQTITIGQSGLHDGAFAILKSFGNGIADEPKYKFESYELTPGRSSGNMWKRAESCQLGTSSNQKRPRSLGTSFVRDVCTA